MKELNTRFKYVWFSRLISILGTGLTEFGVSVWVFSITGKATPMAITMLCSILPSILFAPLSGILCDRFNRKKIIIFADSIAAITSLLLFWYIVSGRFDFSVICTFTALIATANLFDNNAYQASLSTLVNEKELKAANGMNQIIDSINSIITPMLAGTLYFAIGLRGIIIIDLSSYIISIALILGVSSIHFSNSGKLETIGRNIITEVSAGFRFIFSQKGLTLLMIFFALLNFLFNLSGALIEPLSLSIGNSVQLGFVKMCGGVGMMFGSLFITLKTLKVSYGKGILLSALGAGIALIVMGVKDSIYAIAIGRLLLSFVSPISSILAGTLWILKTPKDLQGRVYSARIMVVRCIMPISYLLVGPLVDQWLPSLLKSQNTTAAGLIGILGFNSLNYRLVFVMAGIIVILCTITFFSNKSLRQIGE